MANSLRFHEMCRRLADLRAHMLPAKFSPTGDYSNRQLDRARGYRLLAHAEIESFIEDITLDAARSTISEWSRSRAVSDTLLCLIAHYHDGYDIDGERLEPAFSEKSRPKVKEAIKEVVDVAFRQYIQIHEKNHGVREGNLKRLILPIGVRKDELDQTWIVNLEEFGKRRGEMAHKTAKVQQQIDPKAELDTVKELVLGLKTLDTLVARQCAA